MPGCGGRWFAAAAPPRHLRRARARRDGAVPRERFVPERPAAAAPMRTRRCRSGEGQTISQPWIVAAICQALELRGEETVLEVGAGSGYSAAVLSLLAAEVISVERHRSLAEEARRGAGRARHRQRRGGGRRRQPRRAGAGALRGDRRPRHGARAAARRCSGSWPREGGWWSRSPPTGADMLTVFRRRGMRAVSEMIGPCRFVPLVGEEGFGPA